MSRVSGPVLLLLAVGAHAFGRFGGTTTTYSDAGWCFSELNFQLADAVETPELCYAQCLYLYGDDLVAIDWYDESCYCQDACQCMEESEGPDGVGPVTITRDSAVDALPSECEDVERRKLKSRKWHK